MNAFTVNKQTKITNKLVEDVKDLFNAYFIQMGVSLVPILGVIAEVNTNHLGIKEIVEVVNSTIDRELHPLGISTKSRKSSVIMKRHSVAYICRKLGYPVQQIGKGVNRNYATVIQSCSLVESLLKQKDSLMVNVYKEVVEALNFYHNQKYGKDLPEIIKRGNIT